MSLKADQCCGDIRNKHTQIQITANVPSVKTSWFTQNKPSIFFPFLFSMLYYILTTQLSIKGITWPHNKHWSFCFIGSVGRGVIRVDVKIQDFDVNQCATGDFWFADTHQCNRTSMEVNSLQSPINAVNTYIVNLSRSRVVGEGHRCVWCQPLQYN